MSSFIPKLADHTAPLRDLSNRMLTLRGTHHTWEPLKRESLKSVLQLLPRTTTEMNQFSFMLMRRSRAWVQLYSRTTDQKHLHRKRSPPAETWTFANIGREILWSMAVRNSIPISMEDHLWFNPIIAPRRQRMLLYPQPYYCVIVWFWIVRHVCSL